MRPVAPVLFEVPFTLHNYGSGSAWAFGQNVTGKGSLIS